MAFDQKDSLQLGYWVSGRASLADVESVERFGIVGNERFSERARRRFRIIWEWSTFRFSSHAQDTFWNRHGRAAFYRRMRRVRRLAEFYGARFADKVPE
jgi:hypothetical protein